MNLSKIARILCVIALVCLSAVLGPELLRRTLPGPRLQSIAMTMVGRSESDVLDAMGPPEYIVFAADLKGRTVDFRWKRMNFVPVPKRSITNKVLLYTAMGFAVYIYIDSTGIVEHVAKAAT